MAEQTDVELGIDGKNPVSPNNPPAKAVSEAIRENFPEHTNFEPAQYPTSGAPEAEAEAPSEEETDGSTDLPAKSASKKDWAAYAESQGMSAEDADAKTRDELAEFYS